MTRAHGGRPITVGVADKQHAALSFAAEEARLWGCDIQVVHAYTVPPGPPDVLDGAYGVDIQGAFRDSGREVLADATTFLAEHHEDVVVRPVLVKGSPTQVLTRAAETSRLLVLGPDDATPWYTRLFRSRVSRKLTDAAWCPVVVVPDTWELLSADPGVTLLVDSQTVAHGPLRFAFEHASRHHTGLRVLHVQDPDHPRDESVPWQDMFRLIDSWKAMYPQVWADTRVVAGVPDLETVEAFERTGLLVLGRPHEHHVVSGIHCSLARTVIERADCPVAVVPALYDV